MNNVDVLSSVRNTLGSPEGSEIGRFHCLLATIRSYVACLHRLIINYSSVLAILQSADDVLLKRYHYLLLLLTIWWKESTLTCGTDVIFNLAKLYKGRFWFYLDILPRLLTSILRIIHDNCRIGCYFCLIWLCFCCMLCSLYMFCTASAK